MLFQRGKINYIYNPLFTCMTHRSKRVLYLYTFSVFYVLHVILFLLFQNKCIVLLCLRNVYTDQATTFSFALPIIFCYFVFYDLFLHDLVVTFKRLNVPNTSPTAGPRVMSRKRKKPGQGKKNRFMLFFGMNF